MKYIEKTKDTGGMIARFLADEGYNVLSDNITRNNYRIILDTCEITVDALQVKVVITVRKGCNSDERSTNASFSIEFPLTGNEIDWTDLCLLRQWIGMRIKEQDMKSFDIQKLLVFQDPSFYGSQIKGHVSFEVNGERKRSRIRIEKDSKHCALLDIKLDDIKEEAYLIAEIKKNIDFTPSPSYNAPGKRNRRIIPIEDVLREAKYETVPSPVEEGRWVSVWESAFKEEPVTPAPSAAPEPLDLSNQYEKWLDTMDPKDWV